MRYILKYANSRLLISAITLLVQIVLIVTLFMGLWQCSIYIQVALKVISFVFALIIFNSDINPAFKVSWIILVLTLPLGWVLYLMFHGTRKSKQQVLKYSAHADVVAKYIKPNNCNLNRISKEDSQVAKLCKYIEQTSNMTTFSNTYTKYYPSGECFFIDYIEDLKSAKEYIFLEYFIISSGIMWDTVLNILKDKAQQGVEVRLMYDDMGTISLLPLHYDNYLKSLGINTLVFNPIKAIISPSLNFRNHCKITIIDGKIAYTGGLNLSDEYINKKERFGYWKDSSVKLVGEGVQSMVAMYLQLWNYCIYSDYNTNLDKYFKNVSSYNAKGYVQPFYDNPFNKKSLSENAYMSIINQAKNYVYICTPYLILDNEMANALKVASISGVDVRIITPHIPDKKNVNEVTRSNYLQLIESNIKIFEFKDGFIHSKTIVSDDKIAIVGTANFDFRSFYMHFENGVLMYDTTAVLQVKQDCLNVFNNQSVQILKEDCLNIPLYKKFVRFFLRLFSPLM